MSDFYSMFPNVAHSDRWRITFSNIPGSLIKDMRYYDNFVKSVVLPDYNLMEVKSEFRGYNIRHPVAPKVNEELSQIQIEFKLSEDMWNYLNLFDWMQQIRYGSIDSTHNDFFRKYTIKKINIEMLDNQKRVVSIMSFTEAFILSLSSLSLNQGSSDEITFTVNCSYEEVIYERKSILEGKK